MLQVIAGDFNLERENPILAPILSAGFEHYAGRDGPGVGITHRTHRGEVSVFGGLGGWERARVPVWAYRG